MASKFALQVAERHFETTKTIGAQRLADNVDAALQEVWAVLEGLRNSHGCWCHATEEYEFKPPFVCGEQCQRARALMEKLELK
jgi:hypothetical protein